MTVNFSLGFAFKPIVRLRFSSVLALLAVIGIATGVAADRQAKLFQKKLNKDEQIVHALDRLTLGPRPGDVQRLKKIGLKKWIDEQLHPEAIQENAALETKLQPLESLRISISRQLMPLRQPVPSAFRTASLAAHRAAKCSIGRGRDWQ